MKLIGKCKEDFEKWFRTNVPLVDISIFNHRTTPFSMQYGVYVDFFDSVGIYIDIKSTPSSNLPYDSNIKDIRNSLLVTEYNYTKTRQETRKKAVEKANEIYNESNTRI